MFIAVDWNTAATKKETGRSLWVCCCNETKLLQANPQGSEAAAMSTILF
jgi:hypothetical protein